jgi:hypothetical protein
MIRKIFSVLGQAARKTVGHPRDALLGTRMALWVVLISVLAELTSLARTQRIASFRIGKVRSMRAEDIGETSARLGRAIDSLLGIDLLVFRRSCWKRALVLHRYLALSGIETQIKFGVRKESGGRVDGHAWLERHGQTLLENNAANYIVTFSLPTEHSLPRHSARPDS